MTGTQPRKAHIIGIGMGHPGHLTQDAVAAMRECDVFLVADKGKTTAGLVEARRALCEHVLQHETFEFLTVDDPERQSDGEPDRRRYREGVGAWRKARALAHAEVLKTLPSCSVVGFLAWGDPAFYDSTVRMVRDIAELIPLEVDVVPGLASFQVLAAEAGVGLNTIGSSVHVTTGRRLVEEWRPELGTVVVMLDSYLRVTELATTQPDLEILWGAYLGLPQQVLRHGRLGDVICDIAKLRAQLRQQNGWVMDTYALWPPSTQQLA